MCGAESYFYYGYILVFILIVLIDKALAVPTIILSFKSVAYDFLLAEGKERGREVLPYAPLKCYRAQL